jgi:pilus assembly protein CpaE
MDEMLLSLTDIASKIILVTTPSLPGIKNARFALDVFEKMQYPNEKTMLVLNKMDDDRARKPGNIAAEQIEKYLKRPIDMKIPFNEQIIAESVLKGVPAVASQRDRGRSPVRELVEMSDILFNALVVPEEPVSSGDRKDAKRGGLKLGRG